MPLCLQSSLLAPCSPHPGPVVSQEASSLNSVSEPRTSPHPIPPAHPWTPEIVGHTIGVFLQLLTLNAHIHIHTRMLTHTTLCACTGAQSAHYTHSPLAYRVRARDISNDSRKPIGHRADCHLTAIDEKKLPDPRLSPDPGHRDHQWVLLDFWPPLYLGPTVCRGKWVRGWSWHLASGPKVPPNQ